MLADVQADEIVAVGERKAYDEPYHPNKPGELRHPGMASKPIGRHTWMPQLTRFVWVVWLVVGFAFTYGNYLISLDVS